MKKTFATLLCIALFLHSALAQVETYSENKKYGLREVNSKKIITPAKYDYLGKISDGAVAGRIGAGHDAQLLYLDLTGKEIIKLDSKCIENNEFNGGYAIISIVRPDGFGGASRVIDKKGTEIADLGKYYSVGRTVNQGFVLVANDANKWGFVDIKGKEILPPTYDELSNCSENTFSFRSGENWGYVDQTGKVIVKPIYSSAGDFTNGKAYVEKNGQSFYIDKSGKKMKDE